MKSIKSFTLIELLIVIVIIGILAVTLVPRLKGMQDKAKYTRVQKDFETFRTAVFMAQTNTNQSLKDITINPCSGCACGYNAGYFIGTGLKTVSSSSNCRLYWITSLRRIEAAAGMNIGALSSLETDPRGSPYLLDENEGTSARGGCAYDTLHTAGANGNADGINVINAELNTGDNRGVNIPGIGCAFSY